MLAYTGKKVEDNFLNLPSYIDNNDDQMLHYTYTASGQKLSQELSAGTGLGTLRRYAGPFVFVNDQLAWVNTGHGRVVVSGSGSLSAEFHVRDHLGNTRLALKHDSQGLSPIQYTDYYPFGKIIETLSNYNSTDGTRNRYLYNGKELQDDFDLNWYDYGARFYDAEIARFHSLDPLAEEYSFQSPYAYAANNPIMFIDVFGMGPGKRKLIVKTILEIGVSLAGQKSQLLSTASDMTGVTKGQLLPNPDYDQLDLDMAQMSIDIARSKDFGLEDFVDVMIDVNTTLEDQGLNIIDAYVISKDDLKNLAEGKISIEDISEQKTDPVFVLSEINDDNTDKTEVIFYREPDGFTGKSFLEYNVIRTYGKEEDKK